MSENAGRLAQGHDSTEVRSSPEEWQTVALAQVCRLRGETVDPGRTGTGVYVGLEHIDPGEPTLRRHGDPSEVRSAKALFRRGDVLYGKLRPYLDKAVLSGTSGMCSTDILVLVPEGDAVVGEFLACLLHTAEFRSYAISTMTGVNHPRTSWASIRGYAILLPPLTEQRKIVAVLWAVQEAKEKTEAVIEALKALKRSLMKYLFTYGPVPVHEAENVALKHTEIGEMPQHWHIATVRDLGDIVTGTTPKTSVGEYYGGSYMFICPGDLGDHKHVFVTAKCLSEAGLRVSRALPRASVLVVCIGATIGKTGMTSADRSATNQQINAVVTRKGVVSEYAYYALSYRGPHLPSLAGRAAVPIVNKSSFAEFALPLCAAEEQTRVADALSAVDDKIGAEEERARALGELFRTLLRDLMTARIRVHDLEVEL